MRNLPPSIVLTLLLLLVHQEVSAQPRWHSQTPAVRLAVRAGNDDSGGSATFVVRDPRGTEYRAQRPVRSPGETIVVHFPEDFRTAGLSADGRPCKTCLGDGRVKSRYRGRYQWACPVEGGSVARGTFEYVGDDTVQAHSGASHVGAPKPDAGKRERIAGTQADMRALVSAASIYGAHMGRVPATLGELTQKVRNARGQVAGPFLAEVPSPPPGWSGYAYQANPDTGVFSIMATGDGTTVKVP